MNSQSNEIPEVTPESDASNSEGVVPVAEDGPGNPSASLQDEVTGVENRDGQGDDSPDPDQSQDLPQMLPVSNSHTQEPAWEGTGDVPSARALFDQALGGFDPAVHKSDAEGRPVLTASGEYARKPGRKPGRKSTMENGSAPTPSPAPAPIPTPQQAAASVASGKGTKEAAKMIVAMFVIGTSKMIGPEWKPDDKAELQMLESATENYLQSVGGIEMSPGWTLVMAYGMYSIGRMGHENTRGKFGSAWDWMKKKTVRAYLWARGK